MPYETESTMGSPAGSVMSMCSASTPGTPGSGHYYLPSRSSSTGCETSSSDSFDSDLENNGVYRQLSASVSVMLNAEGSVTVKQEPGSIESSPKKKRYMKSRVRNRDPNLVMKLKKTRRVKANDRERARMHGLNDALEGLRKILPNSNEENKLTKIETLRFAHNYIFALKETLNMLDRGESIDIDDTLYSAQMAAALKMPSASQTLSQLHQQQMQQLGGRTPLPPTAHTPPQLSPLPNGNQQLHQQQRVISVSPLSTSPVQHVVSSPEAQSVGCNMFQQMTSCFTTGTTTVSHIPQFSSMAVSQHSRDFAPSPPAADYSPYSADPWTGASHTSPVFTFDFQNSSSGLSCLPPSGGFLYSMVNSV